MDSLFAPEPLFAARIQMAVSLGFHMLFVCASITFPFLMATSHWKYLKSRHPRYLLLTKAWMKAAIILFAVGAVSGTTLSFQLGLLWPTFMEHAGPIFGMPFSLEGAAFFMEAIFLGFYVYGWDRMPAKLHWFTGVLVGIFGALSGVLVIAAAAWMNAPAGFEWTGTHAIHIDPVAALFNEAWPLMALHGVTACIVAAGMAICAVHAWRLLKGKTPEIHRTGLKTAAIWTAIISLTMPLTGHLSAESVAKRQPAKLAAMEALFHTTERAPFILFGWPDPQTETVSWAIEIPGLLSLLAHRDINAEVIGLDAFVPEDRPPVKTVHLAFQLMILTGMAIAFWASIYLFLRFRPRGKSLHLIVSRRFLIFTMIIGPMGYISMLSGWIVTEVGRQPWIIYGIMRTADSVTPVPGLGWTLLGTIALYGFLTITVGWLGIRQIRNLEALAEVKGV
jgi:cytochrome bd ubiquinol oxidase subunit I